MDGYLVTGATGYVGREVVTQLLAAGRKVTVLGRSAPEADVPHVTADITDAAGLSHALAGRRFDIVLHIASLPGDTGDPGEMVRVNVNGCQNVLESAREWGVKRFVLASSISAYEWYPATKFSAPDYMPVDEEHPCRPRDMYATTKRVQELLTLAYYHQFGVPATVLRLTAVVGPKGRGGGRGYLEMAQKMNEGVSVQIPHFSADELCHYVDIRDVARMFLAASEHPRAPGEIFNCCGPGPTRGSEFAGAIERAVPGIRAEYGFAWSMAQGGEIAFSMEKARRLMGFVPEHTLADSVDSIAAWIAAGGLAEARTGGETFGKGVEQ